ncbi:MAG TPA: polysaccharide biosynthesis/export family protein [Ignavibacteriaceae bacterium]|nr:polysaccharide biosynthesis/export family protein [Ignavibacteriaceae bacterium]
MKNNCFTILMVLTALLVSSCRSSKDFTLFQDLTKNQQIPNSSANLQEYKVRPYDNLYINIKTLNPDVNKLFDASESTTSYSAGTQQMYGDYVSQYINGYQVDSIGSVTLPIIGNISVAGLTLKQIQERVQKRSLEFLKDPAVKVKLLSFKININGEVRNPGVYYSYNERMNILEAISMANGLTDNALINKAIVVRETPKGSSTYNIDLTSKNLLTSEVYYLQPNDLIYIKPGRNKHVELNATSYSLFLTTVTTFLLVYNIFK